MRNFDDRIENAGATAPGRLSAAEDNVRFKEMENFVSTAGITLDAQAGPDTDFNMLAQAAARYASGGVSGSCTGTANTYVVAALGSFVAPKALFTGMSVQTRPSATNTGDSTANVFALGSKKVLRWDGSPLIGGELVQGRPTVWRYDATADSGTGAWLLDTWAQAFSAVACTLSRYQLQNCAHNTLTLANFSGADVSDGPSLTAFGSGIKVLETGVYFIEAVFSNDGSTNSNTVTEVIYLNGIQHRSNLSVAPADRFLQVYVGMVGVLTAGDLVQLYGSQTNGSSAVRAMQCRLTAVRIA